MKLIAFFVGALLTAAIVIPATTPADAFIPNGAKTKNPNAAQCASGHRVANVKSCKENGGQK